MNMIMHGDGHGGIHYHDGLVDVNGIFPERFDIVVTNPPFGSNVGNDQKVNGSDETRIREDAAYHNDCLERYGEAWERSYRRMLDCDRNKYSRPVRDRQGQGESSQPLGKYQEASELAVTGHGTSTSNSPDNRSPSLRVRLLRRVGEPELAGELLSEVVDLERQSHQGDRRHKGRERILRVTTNTPVPRRRGEEDTLVVEPLQEMFATAILKLRLPPDPTDERVYDLNPLRQREFEFVYDVGSGIEEVAVRKLRLSSRVRRGDRITVEADASTHPDAVYDLLEKVGESPPLCTATASLRWSWRRWWRWMRGTRPGRCRFA